MLSVLATPVKLEPSPENAPLKVVAVTIPVNVALPCLVIDAPIPVPEPRSIPVECNKESPMCIEVPGSVPIPAGATLVNDILYLSYKITTEITQRSITMYASK